MCSLWRGLLSSYQRGGELRDFEKFLQKHDPESLYAGLMRVCNEKDGTAYSAAFANLVDACLQKKKRYRSPYTGGGAAAEAAAGALFAWPAGAAGPLDDDDEEKRSIDPSLDPDYAPPRPLAEHPFIVEHDETAFDLREWMESITDRAAGGGGGGGGETSGAESASGSTKPPSAAGGKAP